MKKIVGLSLAFLLFFSMTACGAGSNESQNDTAEEVLSSTDEVSQSTENVSNEAEKSEAPSEEIDDDSKILVVCFSATGNTKTIAEKIVEVTGADYFEIVAEEPYSEDDLNYSDDECRANREQQDESARPAISENVENIEQYDVVLIGHPIWWGMEPRIIDTFMESYDFSGKTLTNFCTSGGSGINTSTDNLKALSPNANWLDGRRFSDDSDAEAIQEWINSLNLE